MPEPSVMWKDTLLLAAEWTARQVYWRSPRLRAWVKQMRARRRQTPQIAPRDELKNYLRGIGLTEGALAMVHTSTSGLSLAEGGACSNKSPSPLLVARQLLADLLELVGDRGTLVMPTHALYQNEEPGEHAKETTRPILYDPATTPCGVGLVNELFWRSSGVQRSLHPYNMLAAKGPLAAELLRDNLNEHKPLPHGIYSGYYRFCQRNGLVVSIGVPLGACMTLIHTAEDVRDQEWPVADFFEEKRYLVRADGREREWIVREPRLEYGMYCLCLRKVARDLKREGILHEGAVGSLRVDWMHSQEVFEFLMQRNERSPYPYYATWMVKSNRRA